MTKQEAVRELEDVRSEYLQILASNVFGEHTPNNCLICPANRILDDLEELIRKLKQP